MQNVNVYNFEDEMAKIKLFTKLSTVSTKNIKSQK